MGSLTFVVGIVLLASSVLAVVKSQQTTESWPTLFPPGEDEEADNELRPKVMAGDYYTTFHNLHLQILQSYNHHIRPEIGAGRPMTCNFSMVITHLENVDEDDQSIDLSGWIILQWHDPRLAWNDSTEFKDIDKILMQQKVIWKPDVHLYNNAHSKLDSLVSSNTMAQIFSDGRVILDPTINLRPYCQFNYKLYPWDTHKCAVYLGSWSYRIHEFQWNLRPITIEDTPVVYSNSHRVVPTNWRIVKAIPQLADVEFDNEIWHYVNVTLYFKRTPTFGANFLLIPAAVGALLTGIAFLSTAARGDWKVIVLLLALALEMVHFIAVHLVLPQGVVNGRPLILTFLKANIFLTLFGLIVSFLVQCLLTRRDEPPSWLGKLLENKVLRLACCFPDDSSVEFGTRYNTRAAQNRRYHHGGGVGGGEQILETNKLILAKRSPPQFSPYSADERDNKAAATSPKITRSRTPDQQQQQDDHRRQSIISEGDIGRTEGLWWRLSVLVDRVLFVVFTIIFAILWGAYIGF